MVKLRFASEPWQDHTGRLMSIVMDQKTNYHSVSSHRLGRLHSAQARSVMRELYATITKVLFILFFVCFRVNVAYFLSLTLTTPAWLQSCRCEGASA